MAEKPFLKWAGGKRWLVGHESFVVPEFSGRYIEPFLGGGAVFFALAPTAAILSDANPRLIETYFAIRNDWRTVVQLLETHHTRHCGSYYYTQRSARPATPSARAAQFIYLNRACWNGLYRVNRKGEFNVPIGTKNWIVSDDDDFEAVSQALQSADIRCSDFSTTLNEAGRGDLVFVDPPYTVAHNFNGFVKYNETIFSWDDQLRLKERLLMAAKRGASIVMTNADHPSIRALYEDVATVDALNRRSVISGPAHGRRSTTELLITLGC